MLNKSHSASRLHSRLHHKEGGNYRYLWRVGGRIAITLAAFAFPGNPCVVFVFPNLGGGEACLSALCIPVVPRSIHCIFLSDLPGTVRQPAPQQLPALLSLVACSKGLCSWPIAT